MWARSGGTRLFYVGALLLGTFASCRCQRPAPAPSDAATDAAIAEVDAGAPAAVLLLNGETINEAMWTSGGAVIALSRRRFWWFRPEDGGNARTSVLDGEDHFPHFAAAKHTDVTVVTKDGRAHVFHGPKETSSFAVEGESAKALSDDGSLLVTEQMESSAQTGTHFRGRIYDLTTGKRLAEKEYVPILSPDGAWMIEGQSVFATRSGEKVLDLPERGSFGIQPAPWFGGRAMIWSRGGLMIADPKARSAVLVPAACKEGEIDQLIEEVDTATKQAVRFCGARVLVVRVSADAAAGTDAGMASSVVEVPVPASRKEARPTLAFARDDGAPLLVWGYPVGAEIDRVDVGARALVKAAKGIEPPRERTTDEAGAASPDGRYRLRVDSFLSRTGELTVREAAGKEVLRFGMTSASTGIGAMAPFVHDHGIEVILDEGAKTRMRIGPEAKPFDDVPLLYPDSHCDATEDPNMPGASPQRIVTGDAAIFTWTTGSSCVCVRGGCADPHLPPGVKARQDSRLIASEPGRSEVTYLEQRKERGSTTVKGELDGAAFLDDGAAAALLVFQRTHSDEAFHVQEVSLPGFEARGAPIEIEHPIFFGWDYTLHGAKSSIAVFMSDRYSLKGWVLPRASSDAGAAGVVRIEAWKDNAVVSFPDGRMELYGPTAARAVVCADGHGNVTPFATCRAQFETKGTFRID